MKKHFNKELKITKKISKAFENSAKYWICDNDYIVNDVKIIDHCYINGKTRGSAMRKFLLHFNTINIMFLILWFSSYYERTRCIQS